MEETPVQQDFELYDRYAQEEWIRREMERKQAAIRAKAEAMGGDVEANMLRLNIQETSNEKFRSDAQAITRDLLAKIGQLPPDLAAQSPQGVPSGQGGYATQAQGAAPEQISPPVGTALPQRPGAGVAPGGVPTVRDVAQATGVPAWLQFVPGGQQMIAGMLQNQGQLAQTQNAAQQLQMRQQQMDREGVLAGADLMFKAAQLKSSPAKKAVLQQMFKFHDAVSKEPLSKEYKDMVLKFNDDELADYAKFVESLATNQDFGIKDLKTIQNPLIALELYQEYQKLKAAQNDIRAGEILRGYQQQGMEASAQQGIQNGLATGIQQGMRQPMMGANPQMPTGVPRQGLPPISQNQEAIRRMAADTEAQYPNIPPGLGVAVARQESQFNPAAVGPNPKDGVGVMQLIQGTGRRYGVAPDERTDPQKNIQGGMWYLSDLLTQHKGDVTQALRAYNGGGDPNYVQNVMRYFPAETQYVQSLRGQQGQQGQQPQAQGGNQIAREIAKIDQQLGQLGAMGGGGAKVSEAYQALIKRRQELTKWNLEPQVAGIVGQEWGDPANVPLHLRQQVYQQAIGQLQGQEAQKVRTEARIRTEEGLVPNPQSVGPRGVPATTTIGELKGQGPTGRDTNIYEKPPEQVNKEIASRTQTVDALTRIEEILHNPEVAKYWGTILSNPDAWLQRVSEKALQGLPEDTQTALTELAYASSIFRHEMFAGNLSEGERKLSTQFLASADANEPIRTAIGKARGLIDGMTRSTNKLFDIYGPTHRLVGAPLPKIDWKEKYATPSLQGGSATTTQTPQDKAKSQMEQLLPGKK